MFYSPSVIWSHFFSNYKENTLLSVFQFIILAGVLIFYEQDEILVLFLFTICSLVCIFDTKIILYIFYASIWISYTMYIEVYSIVIRLNDLIILFIFLSFLFHSAIRKSLILIKPDKRDLPIIGLLILAFYSLFTTLNITNTIFEVIQIMELVFLYYLTKTLINNSNDILVFMVITIIIGIIDSAWIFNTIINNGIGERNVAIFGSTGNELCFSIVFLYLFSLYERRPFIKIIQYLLLVILILSMIVTLGRGLLIISCVMLLASTFIYIIKKRQYLSLIYSVLIAISAVFLLSLFATQNITDRYSSIVEGGENVDMRLYHWYSSAMIIADYPFTGVGLGNGKVHLESRMPETAPEIVKKYSGDSPHNEFLHFGIQVGLFGILFIILFYFTLIKRSAQLLIDRNNDYEIISNALFSMVIGIIVWIFANDMLLAGMGALIILIMAFVDKMNFYINHA